MKAQYNQRHKTFAIQLRPIKEDIKLSIKAAGGNAS